MPKLVHKVLFISAHQHAPLPPSLNVCQHRSVVSKIAANLILFSVFTNKPFESRSWAKITFNYLKTNCLTS